MPNEIDNQKLAAFESAILQETEEKITELEAEVKDYEKTELAKAQEEEYNLMYIYMQEQVRKIKARHKQSVTKFELDAKRELMLFRNQLAGQIFQAAKERLITYTATGDYVTFLTREIMSAAKNFPTENCVILVKPDDLKFELELNSALPFPFTLKPDPKNHIGGFTLMNEEKGVLTDRTFATLLEDQKQGFYANCGLNIEF